MYRQTNKDIDKQRYRQTEKAIRRHINQGIDTIGNLYTDWEIYLQTNGGIRIQTEKATCKNCFWSFHCIPLNMTIYNKIRNMV